jgi:hypothetical protein
MPGFVPGISLWCSSGTFTPPLQFIRNHFLTLRRPAKLAVSKGAL